MARESPAGVSKVREGRRAAYDTVAPRTDLAAPLVPHAIPGMQSALGNRATSRAIARRSDASATSEAAVPNLLQLIAETAPALLSVVPAPEISALEKRLRIAQKNQELAQQSNRIRQQFQARYNLPAEGFGDTRKQIHGLQSQMKPVGGPLELEVSGADLLATDMTVPPAGDVVAQMRFQQHVKQALADEPIKVRIIGSGPGAQVVYYWRFKNRPHARGQLTRDNLLNNWGFAHAYSEIVQSSPERQLLRQALQELSSVFVEATTAHKERSDKNRDHPVVRRIAHFLGGPSMFDVAQVIVDAQENPGKGSLEDRLEELEAPYPSIAIWDVPRQHIDEARKALADGKVEIALLAVMRAQRSVTNAATRFLRYEERVMSGAGVAVKWLERAKFAGKLAAGVASGGYSLGAQALIAGGYSFAQEGAQQVSEVAHGLRESVDVKGLAQKAAVEGAMSLFGGLTQGAFAKTLSARFAEKLTANYGPWIANRVISGAATATSQFYATPANIVLERIIAGGKLPGSIEEFSDMVVDETLKGVATDFGLGLLPGGEAPDSAEPAATGTGNLGATAPEGASAAKSQPGAAGAQPGGMNPTIAAWQAFAMSRAAAPHAGKADAAGAGGGGEPPRTPQGPGDGAGGGGGSSKNPFANLSDAEIDASLSGMSALGPVDRQAPPEISNRAEIVGDLDRTKPMEASGFAGSTAGANPRFGAFEQRIKTEQGTEVVAVVKILRPSKAKAFQNEVAGAKAAAATGLGPPFYGVIDVPGGLAFAMGKVEGGFTQNFSTAPRDSPQYAKAAAETAQANAAISEQTIRDMENYGDALVHLGYHYSGELQGLIGPDGRWRPIDFQGVAPLPADPAERSKAIARHRQQVADEARSLQKKLASRPPSKAP